VPTDAIENRLNDVCLEAGDESRGRTHLGDANSDQSMPTHLPPRQLFLVAQSQFFQNCPWASELFAAARFRDQVERLYSGPLTPEDEPWALCLHTIALLVLGPEVQMIDQNHMDKSHLYSKQSSPSRLIGWQANFSNRPILLQPRLITVQTLALLVRHVAVFRVAKANLDT
jgi:hypothetical protein